MFGKFVEHMFQFPVEVVVHIISFIFCWITNVQNQGPLSIMYNILLPTDSALLTAHMIL
jgi:hypothetical protein